MSAFAGVLPIFVDSDGVASIGRTPTHDGTIRLRVKTSGGRTVLFKQFRKSPLRRLMQKSCEHWDCAFEAVRFTYKGELLDPDEDNPDKIGMREYDGIGE